MLDKLHKQATKGDRAHGLLANEAFTDALAQLKADYITAWELTGINDATAREKLYLAVKALADLHKNLQTVVSDGRLAKSDLDRLSKNKAA
jgi:hypothetical protein